MIKLLGFSCALVACTQVTPQVGSPSQSSQVDQSCALDTAVCSLALRNEQSILTTLAGIAPTLNEYDSKPSDIILLSTDSTQVLRLSMWYGDGANYFSAATVGYNPDTIEGIVSATVCDRYVSNQELSLGMSLTAAKQKVPDCLTLRDSTASLYNYTDGQVPEYYLQLRFDSSHHLSQYSFGYHAP